MHIKNKDKLLLDIVLGLEKLPNRTRLDAIQVSFEVDGGDNIGMYNFTLSSALDHLANDLYWDYRGDWSEASKAIVETI
jgi:hypothetical protein